MPGRQSLISNLSLVKARAKLLARADRRMKTELVALRRGADMSQAEVGALLGVSRQAIQKLERYDSDPKLSTLRRYANAVGAIVEHRVTPDLGQSQQMALESPWELRAVSSSSSMSVSFATEARPKSGWVNSQRGDFGLSV